MMNLPKKQTVKLDNTADPGIVGYVWSSIDDVLINKECRMDETLRDLLTDISTK